MEGITLPAALAPGQAAYTEYGKLPGSIKDDQEGIRQAAQQFESIFVSMWLKAARETNKVFAENSPFSSSELEMHQDMLDKQMAVHLSNSGGVGLAPIIVRQLGGTVETPLQPQPTDTVLRRIEQEPSVERHGSRALAFSEPREFVDAVLPKVQRIAATAGLPALAIVGQAALETGWGSAVPTHPNGSLSHNLFGMKANDWDGSSVDIHSKEFELGRWIDRLSSFRAYPDWESSIADYVTQIKESPRYRGAVDAVDNIAGFVRGLQDGGYATDPAYADKVMAVITRIRNMVDH